jgi:hypothetical protein
VKEVVGSLSSGACDGEGGGGKEESHGACRTSNVCVRYLRMMCFGETPPPARHATDGVSG